jgi:hypothetical protein
MVVILIRLPCWGSAVYFLGQGKRRSSETGEPAPEIQIGPFAPVSQKTQRPTIRTGLKSSEPVACNTILIDAKAAAPSKEKGVQKAFASIATNR